ncbi:MAG: hypothetical protein JSU63_00890 [Phycisphaerales bacterium]|nr:MAG: hypothetical protein JSU63_00890 [Phycisphaerales bacterium]
MCTRGVFTNASSAAHKFRDHLSRGLKPARASAQAKACGSRYAWSLLLLLAGASPAVSAGEIVYVDSAATGEVHDGSTWCNAFLYLQDALDLAASKPGMISEIRVAQGTYRPDQGTNRTPGDRGATFQLLSGVGVKGGLPGV